MVALAHLSLSTCPRLPPTPSHPPTPTDSIRDITGTEKNYLKSQQHLNTVLWKIFVRIYFVVKYFRVNIYPGVSISTKIF